jgi:hypothetical protein
MAAIQAREARKAAANPEKIAGSKKREIRNFSLSAESIGRGPKIPIRHFRTNCPYTVNAIVATM